jgi:hypothetical protein
MMKRVGDAVLPGRKIAFIVLDSMEYEVHVTTLLSNALPRVNDVDPP